MYPVKPTVGIEPTNPYEKAKHDIFTALNSISVLSPLQQEMLAKELFQAVDVSAAMRLMQHLLHGR